jgi:ribosomal protein S21
VLVCVVNGDVHEAIRKLRGKLTKDGILRELKIRESYINPSEAKKAKQRIAERRRKKRMKFREWKRKGRRIR